jgi:hypothetical protein
VENVGNVVETAAENEVVLLHNTHQESTMTALIEVMVATVVTAVAATILEVTEVTEVTEATTAVVVDTDLDLLLHAEVPLQNTAAREAEVLHPVLIDDLKRDKDSIRVKLSFLH